MQLTRLRDVPQCFWRALALAVLFAVVLGMSLVAGRAHAQDLGQPMLVVAAADLQGPYAGAVMLAVPMGDRHIGFILNRPTTTKLSDAYPAHEPSKAVIAPIFFGGPEASDALFAMLARDPGVPAVKLMEGIYLTGNAKKIDEVIEKTPNAARYYAGFVGWMPGELAAEIKRGLFVVRPAGVADLFLQDTSTLYPRLAPRARKGQVAL